MVGIASKKEKRAASTRERPNQIPAVIVTPAREAPGTNATDWARPINIASFNVSSFILRVFFLRKSATHNNNPNMIDAVAIMIASRVCSSA